MNRLKKSSPAVTCGRPRRVRSGMTLIEMLVAMAATLMLMAAVAQAFSIFGKGISGSRSALDTAGRMRSVAWRLRQDLAGATAPTLPPLDPAEGLGYFEIIEGPRTDTTDAAGTPLVPADLVADIDDVLLFTTRSTGPPFRGKFETGTIESEVAEVAWFARQTVPATVPPTYTLYRKQFLVLGYVGAGEFEQSGQNRIPTMPWPNFYETYDLSVSRRVNGPSDTLVPNSLGDLTRRECRFLHNSAGDTSGLGFPYPFIVASSAVPQPHQLPSASPVRDQLPSPLLAGLIFDVLDPPTTPPTLSARRGEDVVLTNVIAFDVRVFDPSAALSGSGTEVITPGDQAPITAAAAYGAFVDLGRAGSLPGPNGLAQPLFTGPNQLRSGLGTDITRVYDTWSLGYESDGIDQDGDHGVDQGTDGFDSFPFDGVIDDIGERETSPPYPYPLRGIEVRIRCYEPTSRQIRQVTVRHTFVPH
jgi:prepilin-type N-terminal cleavage/methylation domain-containing protein